jgi:hypothetical protein
VVEYGKLRATALRRSRLILDFAAAMRHLQDLVP